MENSNWNKPNANTTNKSDHLHGFYSQFSKNGGNTINSDDHVKGSNRNWPLTNNKSFINKFPTKNAIIWQFPNINSYNWLSLENI